MKRTLRELEEDKNSGFSKYRAKRNIALGRSEPEPTYSTEKLLEDERSGYSNYIRRRNLAKKKQQQKEFNDSDDNVGLWDAMTTDKTMDDWKRSREWKKQNQKEIDEAAAQVAAYEQLVENEKFQRKTETMTSADIDRVISDYDSQIAELKNSKVGWFEAMKPGGVTPSERKAQSEQLDSEILKLQNEQGKYRAIRDEKKSREMTESLPADVVELLDSYNSFTTANDRAVLYNLFKPADQRSIHQEIGAQNSNLIKQQAIADKLKAMGYDNYKELAEYRKYITDKEATERIEAEAKELAEENRAVASAVAIATAPSGAVYGFKNFMPQSETDLRPNPYSEYNLLSAANDTMQSTVSDSFEDGKVSAKTKRMLYNTGMSAADSVMVGMFGSPALTGGYFALKSFNSKYNDTLKKGGTTEQAIISGVAAGAAEGICEAASLGLFVKGIKPSTVSGIVKNVVVQAGVNAQEEATTELVNILSDYYINGGLSDYYQNYEYALSAGMTEEDAKEYATKISVEQVTEAAVSGAIMGAGFGTVGSVAGNISYNSAMQDIGKNIVENNAVESELAAAEELGTSESDVIRQLVAETEAYQQAKNTDESYEGTKKQYRSIGRLSDELNTFASDKIENTSVTAIKERLSTLGEKGDVEATAKVVQKVVQNRGATDTDSMSKLSRKERQILKNSPQAQRVLNEISGSRYFKSDGWNTKRAESIDNIIRSRTAPDVEAYTSGKTSVKAAEGTSESKVKEMPDTSKAYENRIKNEIINEGQDKERFDSAFELFKMYGETGRSFETAIKEAEVSDDFTEIQMKTAYDIGVENAKRNRMQIIREVKSIDSDGEIYVTDSENNVVPLSQVNTDETTMSLFKEAAKYGVSTANVFVRGYNRSANVKSYKRAFDAFYAAGAVNGDMSFGEAMKKYGELRKYMHGPDVAKKAFYEGRRVRFEADKKIKQKKQTGNFPSKGEFRNKSITVGEEGAEILYKALAKKTGVDIVRVQRIETRNGQTANAQYDAKNNKITVSVSAQNEWQANVHEYGHYGFAYNPEKMKAVKKAVMDYVLKDNSEAELENMLRQYAESYKGKDRADIEEEFVCDALGGMFSTEEGVQQFIDWLQNESGYKAEEKKNILQKIAEWLKDIIEAIKDILNDGELNGAGKLFAKEKCDELTKIRKMFLEAIDGATVNYREKGAVEGDVRNSIKETKITPDMSEKDRAEVLKNTKLNVVKYEGNDELNSASVLKLKFSYNSKASKILKALGEKFDIFKGYSNENVEIDFYYSRGSLNESVHKQGDISTNFYDFARMLYVFDDVIKNAVPIEVHTDKYKDTKRADRNLKYDYVLLSAFSDDSHIVPVELHIKEYKTPKTENKLYVSITLGKIKIEDNIKVQTADRNQRNNTQLSSIVSLPQLISKINPEYGNFYKYIPKSLLNESQIKSKEIAESDEDYRLKVMRGEDVNRILKDKARLKGYDTDFSYRMDHRAPSAKYDICITDIDRAYGGDGSIYSQYAAHYYGDGRTYDYKAINVIKKARSSPESLITIYRAVPTNVKDTRIRNGDWVTIVKDYAEEHGWRTLDDDYRIIENKVPAKYLFTDGNSIHEFGYDNGNTDEVYKNTKNNVKVAEVTYDDSGQLIPLSKRFDDEKADIRYSLPLSNLNDLHQSNIEKVTELSKVAAQLTAHINYIGSSQTKRTLSTLNIQAVARQLKKEYHSKADIHEITAALEELYNKFEEGRVSGEVVKAHVDSIVDKIINESVYMKPDISDYAKEILRELRSVKIKLSDVQKQQAAYHFGSYNEFRKALMGSVVLSEEGTPLDERWQSLCEQYPGRFDKETGDTDQPYVLYETIKELRNTYEDESGLDIDSVKAQLSADVCAGYISIPTVAEYSNQYAVLEQELLQSLKAEKQMYKKIYSESYENAKVRYDAQVKHLKAEQAEEILRAKARMEQRVQNIADTRIREKKRNRLIKTVKRLDRLLRNPGKGAPSAGTNKYGQEYVHLTNIPEGLKKTVIDFCSIFVDNDAGVFTGKFTDSENVVRKKINELRKQYQNLKNSEAYISTVVSDEMTEKLETLHEIVANKRLAQLTVSELDTLNEIADHLITVINNEVEMWVNGVKTKVNDMGKAALKEQHAKGMKGYRPIMQGVDKIGVMNLKPIYFFEKVGGTLKKLWNDILGGQDRYVRNMQYAQQRFSEIAKKYRLDKWTDDKPLNFKTAQGHEISLTRGQALLVWATWKREGIAGKESKHIFEGGIVYPDAVEKASDKGKNKLPKVLQKVYEDGTAHRLRLEDILKIDEWLTKEQKAYADELVSFLSNDVGAWGNEISMQLYGINKFNEKYYIPFNSAGNYLYRGMGDEGTKLLKSEGFTKETQWGANNPLVVDDFTEVVVKHIERMSMYNSMVIPLDNFSRVWNYQERADADSNDSHQNVKAAFETAWGKEYTKYINDLLRDINGGVMSDSREIGSEWISKFKKAAVMGSASVMIQQPSAVGRAFSEINPVYFAKGIGKNLLPKVYEECKRYAPVAVLKEIGGFDTVGGQSMTDWMLKRDYKGKDKLVAFFKDSQFRDDVISWGPAWADRVTWAHIWLACKNEVKHKGYEGRKGLTGEALLEATGKRFTEVINKTQVYDSVLSRSGIMRSTNTLAKMQTAFMAEPTTSLNMLMSAMSDLKTPGKRGNAVKKVVSVATAQVINSLLVSLVKAARDDDDEKDFWEVYWGETVSNFLDGINPLTMIPFVKDIFSLFMGYSIERSDMTIFSNFVDSINAWRSDKKTLEEKITGTMGSIADMFGIPLKNLMRDIKAVANVYRKSQNESDFSWAGAGVEIKENSFPILKALGIVDDSKDKLLYDAWIKGQKDMYEEYAGKYKSGTAVRSALENQIEEQFSEEKLSYDEAFNLLRKLGYSENESYYKLREISEPAAEEEKEDKNADFFTYEGVEGMQSKADAERDEERKEAEEEGKEYSEDSDFTWYRQALESGNVSDIASERQNLIDRGVTESKIDSNTKSWIKENDRSVINLAESYAAGDLTGFESKVSAIASKYGVEPSVVAGAVRSAAGYQSKEIDGTVYALSDLHISIQSGNSTQSKMIADAIIEAKTEQYVAEGETRAEAEKKARQSVKTSLSSTWKEVYQKADANTRAEIQRQLAATGAWKNRGDIFELTRKWRQEYIRGNQ